MHTRCRWNFLQSSGCSNKDNRTQISEITGQRNETTTRIEEIFESFLKKLQKRGGGGVAAEWGNYSRRRRYLPEHFLQFICLFWQTTFSSNAFHNWVTSQPNHWLAASNNIITKFIRLPQWHNVIVCHKSPEVVLYDSHKFTGVSFRVEFNDLEFNSLPWQPWNVPLAAIFLPFCRTPSRSPFSPRCYERKSVSPSLSFSLKPLFSHFSPLNFQFVSHVKTLGVSFSVDNFIPKRKWL